MLRRLVFSLFLALLSVPAPAAPGIDEVFRKPSGQKTYGEIVGQYVGYRGYQRSYALVIGISDYRGFRDLPTGKDAIAMKDFLLHEAGFDHVHLLTEDKVTKERIEELMVDEFRQLVDGNDSFLLYWSGHGVTLGVGNGAQGFLPLSRSGLDEYSGMISMQALQFWDGLLDARQTLYLLDSCFSGLAGVARKGGRRETAIERLARPSRHLLTAGTADEETIATDALGGSVFTRAVIDGLRGAADAANAYPRDGVVTLNELQGYVSERVDDERRRAGWSASITPQLRDLSTSDGEFFFLTSEEKEKRLASLGQQPTGQFQHGVPLAVAKSGESAPLRQQPQAPLNTYEAQSILDQLGYNPGLADGVFGRRTRSAITRFQRENALPLTGALDEATRLALIDARSALGSGSTIRSPSEGRSADKPASSAPLSMFRDCAACPEMVVLPGGTFMMGSPEIEEGRRPDEGPQRQVSIASFALARTEVTFDQWQACVDDGHCTSNKSPYDNGWGRGSRPVIKVSWNDVNEYIAWLNGKVKDGDPYRLPSEAEWEYAARSGTMTPFAFGETISPHQAKYKAGLSGDTVPVEALDAANAWGLRHMHGNVAEWVEDCWHDSYSSAPTGGGAWLSEDGGDCAVRVNRGGSTSANREFLRSANRSYDEIVYRYSAIGFRPARTLSP